jgi:hypothetical protein
LLFQNDQDFAKMVENGLFFSQKLGKMDKKILTIISTPGPRRIFTTRPVDDRYLVHSVQFGRKGRLGWLQVNKSQAFAVFLILSEAGKN